MLVLVSCCRMVNLDGCPCMIPIFGMFYQAGRGETANPSLVRLDGGWRLGCNQASVRRGGGLALDCAVECS